jgi:transcriptional regulator with XRE-family HTH domain
MTNEELVTMTRLRQRVRSGAAKAIRLSAGLSLPEVAAAAGVKPNTVWRWEQSQRLPRASAEALRYAALLDSLLREGART